MKVYLVYRKTFYKNDLGYDQQIADAGEAPYIFTSKKNAEKNFYEMLENRTKLNKDELITKVRLFPMTHYQWEDEWAGTKYRNILYLQEVETI